jgi:general secretion pathway protein A
VKNADKVGKMYNKFFGFSEKPFELTPDPDFLYLSHELREVLAIINFGIIERRGFVLLVGEPGTGKTTLINSVMDQLQTNIHFAYIFNPALDFNDLLHTVLTEFEIVIKDENLSKSKAMNKLNSFAIEQFEKEKNIVIIVDEAQYLEGKTLENLRLLSNLETRKHKLIQIILAGQPELETTLSHPKLRQLAQRIGHRCRTNSFDVKDTYEYIDHRLKVAGYDGPQLFGNKAKKLIWTNSRGIPRMINIICDNALLIGFATNKKRIDSSIINEVIEDLKSVPLDNYDHPHEKSAEIIQAPADKLAAENNVPAELSEQTQEDSTDIVEKIKQKFIHEGETKTVEKNAKQFSVTWIAVIVGVVILFNVFVLYFFSNSFKDFKNEFYSKLETMKDHIQTQSDRIDKKIGAPISTDQQAEKELPTGSDKKQVVVEPELTQKYPFDHIYPVSRTDDKNVKAKNWIVVKKGETLVEIITREYGKMTPRILEAILNINPEIKDPDLIFENQTIKLPEKFDID